MRRVSKTSPRSAIYDKNYRQKDPSIWTCLTCELCSKSCPQGISFTEFVEDERRGGKPLEVAHKGVFTTIAEMMANTPGRVSDLEGEKNSEYGYFPGCLEFQDAFFGLNNVRFGEIAVSSIKLLNKLGIHPKIMQMKCCGHDQKWQGKQKLFQELASYNEKYIKESGIKTLVVSCAECYRTLSLDYKLQVKVVHIAELLHSLGLELDGRVTYHDPCRLGRHMGVYDAPRLALEKNGVEVVEMRHHREQSLCCGVSSLMNCNEQTKALRIARMNEAEETGAPTLITTCPKCLAHFNCLKQEIEYPFKVEDLTTYLARKVA